MFLMVVSVGCLQIGQVFIVVVVVCRLVFVLVLCLVGCGGRL